MSDYISREMALEAIRARQDTKKESDFHAGMISQAYNSGIIAAMNAVSSVPRIELNGNEMDLTIGELRGFQGRSISDGEFSGKGGWVD